MLVKHVRAHSDTALCCLACHSLFRELIGVGRAAVLVLVGAADDSSRPRRARRRVGGRATVPAYAMLRFQRCGRGRRAVRGLHAARRSAQNAALAHDRAAWAECRQPPAPAHVAPGAPGGPPNKDLTCVSVRRHPGEVQGRDRITQGRDADEGFRRRRRSGPGAPPMMLLLVAHLLQVSAGCEPGLALLQGFFLLYTYMKSGEKCAGAAWLLFRPALPCFH